MRYHADTTEQQLRTAVFKELMRFFQAGRVPLSIQRDVLELATEDINDRELAGDWDADWRGRHGDDK